MNAIIQTPTPKLEDSLNFYEKLNFTTIPYKNAVYVSDGKVVIQISSPLRQGRNKTLWS